MNNNLAVQPGSDEKVMAGLSHLLGLIPAIIFWALKKEESDYVRHQSLQAIFYNIFYFLASLLAVFATFALMMVVIVLVFGLMVLSLNTAEPEAMGGIFSVFSLIVGLFPSLIGVFFLIALPLRIIGIIASIQTFMGKPWRYPLIARWVDGVIASPEKAETNAG
jgi:hypothetical protein